MIKPKALVCFFLIVAVAGLAFGQPAPEKKVGKITGAPKPGGAAKLVEELARTNPALAKMLFSPTLYPALAK